MNSLLRLVYDYRELIGRRLLRLDLSEQEAIRLAVLQDFLTTGLEPQHSSRRTARHHGLIPARLRLAGHDEPTYLINLGGGGAALAPPPRGLYPGAPTVVTARDTETGRDFRLPARVVWCSEERAGLAFVGVPVAIRHLSSLRGAA